MSDPVVDGDLLHRELTARLAPHLPPGGAACADFADVGGFALDDDNATDLAGRVEYELWLLEDAVMRELTHEMWPQGPGQGPTDPPRNDPHAEVHDGRLRVWWGDRDAPVLALDPIPVEAFLRPA